MGKKNLKNKKEQQQPTNADTKKMLKISEKCFLKLEHSFFSVYLQENNDVFFYSIFLLF